MRIAFFSGSDFTLPLLQSIHEQGHVITLVTKDDTELRGKIYYNKLKQFALENNVRVWQPSKLKQIAQSTLETELAGCELAIVASYGYIIPQGFLDFFRYGMINWHPSRLPHYRGPTPIQSAIANGDSTTAVTWIEMNTQMDAGPIIEQIEVAIDIEDTTASLLEKCIKIACESFESVLTKIIVYSQQRNNFQQQDHSQATYTALLKKEDGIIDPTTLHAQQLRNLIRAYYPFPRVFISHPDLGLLRIEKCGEVTTLESGTVVKRVGNYIQLKQGLSLKTYILCKQDMLEILSVTDSNGKRMDFRGKPL